MFSSMLVCRIQKKEISIFEIGFGTGLNALLALNYAISNQIKINYFTIEKFPVGYQTYQELNYAEQININFQEAFFQLHSCNWNEEVMIDQEFLFKKIQADFNNFIPDFSYDLIFMDAFAPDIQPELWTKNNFTKLYKNLNSNGILTTYSAKGDVKRSLEASGFVVKRIPGPPGKREMIRAIKAS
jgi:tRNA U34 5-methylaminomethyl-2-thiouridine-forming methyltransferase MnmC